MANTLLLKKSGSTGETPSSGELSHGELAINYADGKLFFKNSGGSVVEFLSSPGTGAGQVTFSNGSTITGDSTFFYDDSNNRLGIGVASPVTTLDIHSGGTEVAAVFGMADDDDVWVATRVAETQNKYGAYAFVSGSGIFGTSNYKKTISQMREELAQL